jgi:hypothetical protein
MQEDDEAARKARAEKLREKIDRLKVGPEEQTHDESAAPDSPREFVDRRMDEIDSKDEGTEDDAEDQ